MIATRLARAATLCVFLLAPAYGRAEDAVLTVDLDYSAAPTCPSAEAFKDIVSARLGYDAFRAGAPDRVVAHIDPVGRAFEGRIEWRDAKGTWQGDRTFPSRSEDCDELARAMAFALAVQVQLLMTTGGAEHTAASPPEESATTEAAKPPPAAPEQKPPSREERAPLVTPSEPTPRPSARPAALHLGVGGSAGFGISSSMVGAGRAFGSVAWPFFAIELAAELGLPATVRRSDGAGFSHYELLASLAGCGSLQRWSACLVGKVGQLRISGKDIEEPTSSSGLFAQTGIRLALMQPLGRRAFVATRAEGLVTLTRWSVSLDQIQVWTCPRFAGTVGLDVGVRFQ
jgi:hypothetical protein